MAIQQVIRPYELLIRWDKEGNIQGAHRIDRNYLVDDMGRIIGEANQDAAPLSLENLHEDPVMTEATASALATSERHRGRIAELEARIEQLENDLFQEQQRGNQREATIRQLERSLLEAATTLDNQRGEISRLSSLTAEAPVEGMDI